MVLARLYTLVQFHARSPRNKLCELGEVALILLGLGFGVWGSYFLIWS